MKYVTVIHRDPISSIINTVWSWAAVARLALLLSVFTIAPTTSIASPDKRIEVSGFVSFVIPTDWSIRTDEHTGLVSKFAKRIIVDAGDAYEGALALTANAPPLSDAYLNVRVYPEQDVTYHEAVEMYLFAKDELTEVLKTVYTSKEPLKSMLITFEPIVILSVSGKKAHLVQYTRTSSLGADRSVKVLRYINGSRSFSLTFSGVVGSIQSERMWREILESLELSWR